VSAVHPIRELARIAQYDHSVVRAEKRSKPAQFVSCKPEFLPARQDSLVVERVDPGLEDGHGCMGDGAPIYLAPVTPTGPIIGGNDLNVASFDGRQIGQSDNLERRPSFVV
jgi:hypothetical protein